MSWRNAVDVGDLADGEPVRVRIKETDIALVRLGPRVFGISNICTHALAYLSDGYVDTDDASIECPLHQARFDLETGRRLSGPRCDGLQVFPVKVEDGTVYVEVD